MKKYFKDLVNLVTLSERPKNIRQLMLNDFRYYFTNDSYYLASVVKGGRCSKNETSKNFIGYFTYNGKILVKRYTQVNDNPFTKIDENGRFVTLSKEEINKLSKEEIAQKEEEHKRHRDFYLNTSFQYKELNLYCYVFFNFQLKGSNEELNKELLDFIKKFIKDYFKKQLEEKQLKDLEKDLFQNYLRAFNQELDKANEQNIDTFISFIHEKPLIDSFILNSTNVKIKDLKTFLESSINTFKLLYKSYEDEKNNCYEKKKNLSKIIGTYKELEIVRYVFSRVDRNSQEKLTDEDIKISNMEDKEIKTNEDLYKKYLIKQLYLGNLLTTYYERIENYSNFTYDQEQEKLFNLVFSYEPKEIVKRGLDNVIQAITNMMCICGKKQISESDLLLLLNIDNLSEIEKKNLLDRLSQSNKEDVNYILEWKKAEIKETKLNNDLKALEKELKQAQKEDRDTSQIIEDIEIKKHQTEISHNETHGKSQNIIPYNKGYYINKGKIPVFVNYIESGKMEIANKDRSVILLIETKTAVNESETTHYIFERLLSLFTESNTKELNLSFREVEDILKRCKLLDENEKEKSKLSRARNNFYEECNLLKGISIKYAIYKVNGILTDKIYQKGDKGDEPIIVIEKKGDNYKIRLCDFLYNLLKICKKYQYIPYNAYDISIDSYHFITSYRTIVESSPLTPNKEFTIPEFLLIQPYSFYISREEYTGKDYNRILQPIKDQMTSSINENIVTIKTKNNKQIKDLNENDKFTIIELNPNSKYIEHKQNNKIKGLEQIKKHKIKKGKK